MKAFKKFERDYELSESDYGTYQEDSWTNFIVESQIVLEKHRVKGSTRVERYDECFANILVGIKEVNWKKQTKK